MKKFILILALCLLPILSVSAQENPVADPAATPAVVQSPEDKMKAEVESFVKVVKESDIHAISLFGITNGGIDFCSGTLLETTETYSKILTAKHCISTQEELYAETKLVKRIEVDTTDDLAVIYTDPIEGKTPVVLAEKNEPIGQLVFSLGYPNGMDLHLATGYTLRYSKDWGWARLNIIPGCSGGGVYNKFGELIGVAWGAIGKKADVDGSNTMAIFEPVSDVKRFLAQIEAKK